MKPEQLQFIAALRKALTEPLPGIEGQALMIPPTRRKQIEAYDQVTDAKLSAVLLLFFPSGDELHFVLIKRASYDGVHSGQIALPGGQMEETDKDLLHTALREAEEEISIDGGKVEILGSLSPLYIPPSHFKVFPFVGIYPEKPVLKADGFETIRTIDVNLSDFLNPACQTNKEILSRTGEMVSVPCFYLYEKIVWGATAMMLSELLYILRKMS